MSRRILIVDDDRAMVKTLCDIFTFRGWEARGVYSGREALEAQKGGKFPVVLMDIRMEDLDGISASKVIRTEAPDVRVVLMTAHTGPVAVRQLVEEQSVFIVQKPIDMPALLSLLERTSTS